VRPTLAWRVVIERALSVIVSCVIASVALTRVFDADMPRWLLPAVAAASGAVVTVAHRLGRVLRSLIGVAVVVGAAGIAVVVLGGSLPADLLDGVANGLGDLLSTTWPTPTSPAVVVPIVALTALMSALATGLGVQGRGVAALSGPVSIVALAALGAAPAGRLSAVEVAALIAASALVLASTGGSQLSLLRPGGAAVVVGVLIAAATVSVDLDRRFDPRSAPSTTSEAVEIVSPLERVAEWQTTEPREEMFRTDLDEAATWTLVHLDRYDGVRWSPGGDFRELAPVRANGADGETVIRVELISLDEPWLPTVGEVVGADTRLAADDERSSFLILDPIEPGAAYSLHSRLRSEAVSLPDVAESPGPDTMNLQIDVPTSLRELATVITRGSRTDMERSRRLATHLSQEFALDPTAPPGHSLPLLDAFLTRSGRGTQEQFVAAYALLAATLGLPVRIAVGFETSVESGSSPGAVAWSNSARAWPEVKFDDLGWVPFDPVPESTRTTDSGRGSESVAPVGDDSSAPPTVPPPEPQTIDSNEPERQPQPAPPPTTLPAAIVAPLLGLALAAAAAAVYIAVVVGFKRVRRRRRARAVAAGSLAVGALETARDLVVDLGGEAPDALTDHEFVIAAAPVLKGAERLLRPIAQTSTAAMFAPGGVSVEMAERSWAQLDEFESLAVQRVGRTRYIVSLMRLRSFRRRARSVRRPTSRGRGRGHGASQRSRRSRSGSSPPRGQGERHEATRHPR
jgi:hypothetical protein